MRCNQASIFIERFGKYVPHDYPSDVQRISVYCDDSISIYAALAKANAMAVNPELSLEFEKHERELQIALDKAILLAAKYHSGQRDKQGENYILHPLRVMLHTTDALSRMTAVLHDILEDTECTEDTLREEGIPESVIENVKCLTRCKDEDYFAYINRVNQDCFCKCIKQKDIEDNLREGCPESLKKRYGRALEILKEDHTNSTK